MTIILQSYCILLSVLFCINRQLLSIFDANHALLFISSPFAVQVTVMSIARLFGFQDNKRVKFHPLIIYILGALLFPLWFGLYLTLRLSTRAFIDSELCSNPGFEDWLKSPFETAAYYDSVFICLLLLLPMLGLFRLIKALDRRMMKDSRAQEGASEPRGRSHTLWISVRYAWHTPVLGA